MKKIIITFLSFVLYFNSISTAYASNLGGWALGNPVAQGASAVVNATKTAIINGASVVKNSTAKITPTATQVAKVLSRGAAGYALSVAVEQLLGSVDWVLDPANNSIRYYEDLPPNDPSSGEYYITYNGVRYYSPEAFCTAWNENRTNPIDGLVPVLFKSGSTVQFRCNNASGANYTFIGATINPAYDPDAKGQEKSIPLETVAQQVISNAAGGDAAAQQAIVAAAQDIINEAETDNTKARPIVNQLEANAETATDETATGEAAPKADPVTGEQAPPLDLSLEFPKFCTWAPTICEAAQVVLTFPNTLTEWWESANQKADYWVTSISEAWTAAKEWASTENKPDDESTEVDIIPDTPPALDTGILTASGQCPADFSYPFPLPFGGTHTISYSYATACYWFSKLYFVVLTVASVISYKIVTGTQGRSEDG